MSESILPIAEVPVEATAEDAPGLAGSTTASSGSAGRPAEAVYAQSSPAGIAAVESAAASGTRDQADASIQAPPALNMLADSPLATDRGDQLGFTAYANALAGVLDNPSTDTPLTIAISAPWGAGKTSLANMVTSRLVNRPLERGDRPHIVCWFNAWLHE